MRKYETDGSSAEALWSSLTVSTYKGLTYDKANSSAFQAIAAHGAHGRVFVNDAKSVINNTTNLSEGLGVINNTNAKMTCVVVFSINALMIYVVAGLCDLWPVWLSFQSTFDDLCRRSSMRSIYTLELSSAPISICRSSICQGIRLSSSLVKSLALSSVLVRVYWLDGKGSPLVCHRY